MKRLPLLPHVYQKIGFLLFIPFLALGIANFWWDYEIPFMAYTHYLKGTNFSGYSEEGLTDEFASIGLIISMLLISFSKEKVEDEAIQFFRLASLQWAVILNYVILIVCIAAIYSGGFFVVMIYNMFTILLIFIIRFRFLLFQYNKTTA